MALYADDAQHLRWIAGKLEHPGSGAIQEDDIRFLEDLSKRIIEELAEPLQHPWPGPDDVPEKSCS